MTVSPFKENKLILRRNDAILMLIGGNGDREVLSRDSKERSSKRSVKSVKEKDSGKENVDAEKREKKILHRIEKIERTEKVEAQERVLLIFFNAKNNK